MKIPLLDHWKTIGSALLMILAGVALWFEYRPEAVPTNTWEPVKPAPQVAKVDKVAVHPKQVQVYAPKAKAKLRLPESMQAHPEVQVIAATAITASAHPQSVVTTINTDTGQAETFIREEPLPWLALRRSGELSLHVGYKGMQKITRLSITQDMLQVKAIAAGVHAALDSDGQYFIGAGMTWRW